MTAVCAMCPPGPVEGMFRGGAPLRTVVPTFTPVPIRVNFTAGGMVAHPLGLILHVQVGGGSLAGWFGNPAAQVSAHLWAGKNGQREQYVDLADMAWAEADGNPFYISIETEGMPSEPLTGAQLDTVAVAYADGCRRFGWPLTLADAPGAPGLGWHGMGGAAYGGHYDCPGDLRKTQRSEILARAAAILTPPGDDMPTAAEVADAVWTRRPPAVTPAVRQNSKEDMDAATYNKVGDVQASMKVVLTALAHLSAGNTTAAAQVLHAAQQRPAEDLSGDDLLRAMAADMASAAGHASDAVTLLAQVQTWLGDVAAAVGPLLPAGMVLPPAPWIR